MSITAAPREAMRLFEMSSYEVKVRENVSPPVLLIDLNTTLESAGRPVVYDLRSSHPTGRWQ